MRGGGGRSRERDPPPLSLFFVLAPLSARSLISRGSTLDDLLEEKRSYSQSTDTDRISFDFCIPTCTDIATYGLILSRVNRFFSCRTE